MLGIKRQMLYLRFRGFLDFLVEKGVAANFEKFFRKFFKKFSRKIFKNCSQGSEKSFRALIMGLYYQASFIPAVGCF